MKEFHCILQTKGGIGQGKRYPPPRTRPPGLTPEEIDAMMDPDRDLDRKR
jgi:hypothetical protein